MRTNCEISNGSAPRVDRRNSFHPLFVIVAFLLMVLAVSSCSGESEPEESITFYDKHDTELFTEKLDKTGVRYRLQDDGTVYYHVSNRDAVQRVAQEVHSVSNIATAYSFRDPQNRQHFVSMLSANEILVKEFAAGDRFVVVIPQKDSVRAAEIYNGLQEHEKK